MATTIFNNIHLTIINFIEKRILFIKNYAIKIQSIIISD